MTASRTTHRPPWLLVSAAWVGPAILAGFEAYMQAQLANRPIRWQDIVWQSGDWLIYAALTPIVFWLGGRFPLRGEHRRRHLLIHFVASLMLCAAWASTGSLLRAAVLPNGADGLSARGLASWFFTSLPFGVAVYFAVLGIVHAFQFFVEARERETQAVRLSAQLAEAKLGALRMQLNPHFLFNSLNAITVLVRDQDTSTAIRVLEQLGDVLRQVLRADREHEVALAEELAFIEQYLSIEQLRFSDRLQPTMDVDPAVRRAAVPSLVLQPLIENALKHGIARRTSAGHLRISAQREGTELVLTVRDDGPGLGGTTSMAGGGVGIANTRERLATLYGDRASLTLTGDSEGTEATVRLPYREMDA